MRRRLGTTEWMFIGCGLVLVVLVADYIRATMNDPNLKPPVVEHNPYQTDFNEGQHGPDFTLPDGKGATRRFSKLAGEETLLAFVSDDQRSRALLRYVAKLADRRRQLKKQIPVFVTVADFAPGREKAFIRETGLEQVVLYEQKDGPIARQFRAEPRPRLFQFVHGLGTSVIGASPAMAPLFEIGKEVLMGWRHRSPALQYEGFVAPEPVELKKLDPPQAPVR